MDRLNEIRRTDVIGEASNSTSLWHGQIKLREVAINHPVGYEKPEVDVLGISKSFSFTLIASLNRYMGMCWSREGGGKWIDSVSKCTIAEFFLSLGLETDLELKEHISLCPAAANCPYTSRVTVVYFVHQGNHIPYHCQRRSHCACAVWRKRASPHLYWILWGEGLIKESPCTPSDLT